MELFLTLVSGVAWMIVYEECIRLGFRDKSCAMPFFALGLNFAWELINFVGELIFRWHGQTVGLTAVQVWVNGFWAILDIVILITYLRYGKYEWPENIDQKWFFPWVMLGLVCCFSLQIVFIVEFGGVMAAEYSAFLQNLLMSILFIAMFARRGDLRGQSVLLAIAKWLGTLAPTVLMGVVSFNALVLVSGILCSVFDLIYIALLVRYKKGRQN